MLIFEEVSADVWAERDELLYMVVECPIGSGDSEDAEIICDYLYEQETL